MPVPAPATAELLRGREVVIAGGGGERLTPTAAAILATWTEDASNVGDHSLFNGNDFYDTGYEPVETGWTEAASGQMFLAPDSAKRGPFADEAPW